MASRYTPENPPAELLESIRCRLAGVCTEWPPELFDAVTLRAAWLEFKYDRAMTEGFAMARIGEVREAPEDRPTHV